MENDELHDVLKEWYFSFVKYILVTSDCKYYLTLTSEEEKE